MGAVTMMTDNTEFDDLVGKKSPDVNESGNGEAKDFTELDGKDKLQHKKQHYLHKYSKDMPLVEAVIVGGPPSFIQLKRDGFILLDKVELNNIILKPKDLQSYASQPYVFESQVQIEHYLNLAKQVTDFDKVFSIVKTIYQKYVDAEDHYIALLTADTIYSYFQDIFGTTHYLICIGDNSSGKNSILLTFANLGYRVLLATSVSAPNVYSYLGTLEECQGCIAEDEINNLDDDIDKLNIYKSGYSLGSGRVPKLDFQSGRVQEIYLTYCFKIFAAAKSLDNSKAKGLLDRAFEIKCIAGRPQHNIKEVFEKANEEKHVRLRGELEKTRKILFAYRMLHYNDIIKDVNLNIFNREAELTKPVIRLFRNSPKALKELLPALTKCLNVKRELKNSSLEAVIYGAVRNLIPYHTHVIDNKTIVEEVKRLTGGEDIEGQQAFYCTDIGHVSHRRIFGICEDKLKAKRTSKGRDIDKKRALEFLEEALKKKDVEYDLPKEIEILESDNERQDNDSEKVDSFDSILFSSGTQGTVGTLLEGVNESVIDNNLVDEKTKGTLQIQSSLRSENIEASTILLETSDNRDRHLPEPFPAFTPSPPSVQNNTKADFYSGYWHCKTCSHKDDGPGMKDHICKGVKK
jgi:hypothetical protein